MDNMCKNHARKKISTDDGKKNGKEDETFFDVVNDEDRFEVKINVKDFKGDEISVRTREGELIVECKTEEKPCGHETLTRTHTRSCALPRDLDAPTLTATLAKDATLHVQGRKLKVKPPAERVVQIKIL